VYQKILKAIRLHDWWHFILPPIFAFYLTGIQLSHSESGLFEILSGLIKVIALAIPVASFGFFLNEWTDISEDAAAGKANYVAGLSFSLRVGVLFVIIIAAAGILIAGNFPPSVLVLLLIQLLLLIAYSVLPVRLKRFPIAAVILDALYSGPLFFMIALILSMGTPEIRFLLMALIFGFLKGLRNIIFHLEQDKNYDLAAGKKTFAQLVTTANAQKTQEVFWILEGVTLLFFCYFTTTLSFTILLIGFVVILIKRNFYSSETAKPQWLGELNTLYEIWFPIAVMCGVFHPLGWGALALSFLALLFFFPYTRKIFHELYIALYNGYYFVSDLYFIYTKPYFDIGKFLRKIFRRQ
jgi:4-hydroxybenzoate polyprenyltransferase